MKPVNKKQVERLRQRLEELASRVRGDATAMLERARSSSGGNSGSELSNAPFHLGDMGTEEYLYDLNNTLLANEQYIDSEVREALRRMDQGNYGLCESCGKSIAVKRLEALPFVRLCVDCAALNDGVPQVSLDEGRPHKPADTLAPEGEMAENHVRPSNPMESPQARIHRGDIHAAGTAGGGTPVGGLAGSNQGNGEPIVSELDEAAATSYFDVEDDRADKYTPRSGPSGGAVGGTPARKRAT